MPYKDKDKARQSKRNYYLAHKERIDQCNRASYQKHKSERRRVDNLHRLLVRKEVLMHYGNGVLACVKCGFSDYRALSLDHINGGGKQAERDRKGTNFSQWLRAHGLPEGVQTLCMNCQFIKKLVNKEQT